MLQNHSSVTLFVNCVLYVPTIFQNRDMDPLLFILKCLIRDVNLLKLVTLSCEYNRLTALGYAVRLVTKMFTKFVGFYPSVKILIVR